MFKALKECLTSTSTPISSATTSGPVTDATVAGPTSALDLLLDGGREARRAVVKAMKSSTLTRYEQLTKAFLNDKPYRRVESKTGRQNTPCDYYIAMLLMHKCLITKTDADSPTSPIRKVIKAWLKVPHPHFDPNFDDMTEAFTYWKRYQHEQLIGFAQNKNNSQVLRIEAMSHCKGLRSARRALLELSRSTDRVVAMTAIQTLRSLKGCRDVDARLSEMTTSDGAIDASKLPM